MQYIQQLITQLSADPAQKPVVKQATDSLAQLTNIVKGFAQRQQQAGGCVQTEIGGGAVHQIHRSGRLPGRTGSDSHIQWLASHQS